MAAVAPLCTAVLLECSEFEAVQAPVAHMLKDEAGLNERKHVFETGAIRALRENALSIHDLAFRFCRAAGAGNAAWMCECSASSFSVSSR
jgi:hypothetical protein